MLLSPIWAVEPASALKNAIYMTLTNMICYHVVLVLKPREILAAVLIATGFIGGLNFFLGAATGNFQTVVFVHKNVMGISMMVLFAAGLAVFLDQHFRKPQRLLAIFLASLAAFLVMNSNSATAILVSAGAGGLCIAGALFLTGRSMSFGRLAFVCLVASLVFNGASQGINHYEGNIVEDVLDHFGKDTTLTGRTILWQYAERQIEENPLLGVGYGGFWRYHESPLVQRIYEEFHKGEYALFQFHNTFYEAAVHQGLSLIHI